MGGDFHHLLVAGYPCFDEFLVFPTVLDNRVDKPHHEGGIGPGTDAHKIGRLGGQFGKTRVHHHDRRVVCFLGMQNMLHGHRMRLRCVRTDKNHALGMPDIIQAVGHCPVTPCIGDTCHR